MSHISFSLLGIYLILILGTILILIDYTIEPITNSIRKCLNRQVYKRLEWQTNGILQLQRLAHEAIGYGTWSGATRAAPVTQRGEKLSILNVTNTKHPVLIPMLPESKVSSATGQKEDYYSVEEYDETGPVHGFSSRGGSGYETDSFLGRLHVRGQSGGFHFSPLSPRTPNLDQPVQQVA